MKSETLLNKACEAQAKALSEFGYESVTAATVREAHGRWKAGGEATDVIDMFCFDAFRDHPDLFGTPDA